MVLQEKMEYLVHQGLSVRQAHKVYKVFLVCKAHRAYKDFLAHLVVTVRKDLPVLQDPVAVAPLQSFHFHLVMQIARREVQSL
jgi:hypothetical protein